VTMKIAAQLLNIMHSYMKELEEEEDEEKDLPSKPDTNASIKELPQLVQAFLGCSEAVIAKLSVPEKKTIKAQNRQNYEALGPLRLSILEALTALTEPGFPVVVRKLLDTDLLTVMWKELVVGLELSTFCHRYADKLTQNLLLSVGAVSQVNCLKKLELPHQLITAERETNTHPCTPFLHLTGRFLQLIEETNEPVAEYIRGVPGWTEHCVVLDAEKKKARGTCLRKKFGNR